MLLNEGFSRVYSLEGGIKGWNGFTAEGPPETGMVLFSGAETIMDHISISWTLEESTRLFYETCADNADNPEIASVYRKLSSTEKGHQARLHELYRIHIKNIPKIESDDEISFPPSGDDLATVLENGVRINEALEWSKGRSRTDILEYAMAMEAQLMDLYSRMESVQKSDETAIFFHKMASEEKDHFRKLARMLDSFYDAF